jgi:hypothetical protein
VLRFIIVGWERNLIGSQGLGDFMVSCDDFFILVIRLSI